MCPIKVLFTDVDGVVNAGWAANKPEYKRNGALFVIPQKLELLQRIVEQTDTKLILSSTWRFGYYDLQKGIKSRDADDYLALVEKFQEYGLEFFSHTPVLNESLNHRGEEIDLWLKTWDGEPIESYAIVDDLNGCFLRPHSGRLVRTSFSEGLLPKHVDRIIELLNKPLAGEETENNAEPETMVSYSWSEDGLIELCRQMEDTLMEDTVCDYCDQPMKAGEQAVFLLSMEDGDEYTLHPECARRGCSPA